MKKVFLGILAAAILVSVGATASLAAGAGSGRRFVDANDDGVCDRYVSGQGRGCDYGWGHGHGQGHHRQGRGCGFRGGCGR